MVLQPEKMVIREAERAISYLSLFNYPVDSIVVNRLLPDAGAVTIRLRRWRAHAAAGR